MNAAKLPQPKLICTLGHKLHIVRDASSIQEATKGIKEENVSGAEESPAGKLHF